MAYVCAPVDKICVAANQHWHKVIKKNITSVLYVVVCMYADRLSTYGVWGMANDDNVDDDDDDRD